ncbi:MAG: hypothetical protein JNK86_03395 [Alphaproteobacteria bacterium]|nr:hypothetical protein [Alphaproteobacteria bacterium]
MRLLTKVALAGFVAFSVLGLAACGESDVDKAKRLGKEACEKNITTNIPKEQRDKLVEDCKKAVDSATYR